MFYRRFDSKQKIFNILFNSYLFGIKWDRHRLADAANGLFRYNGNDWEPKANQSNWSNQNDAHNHHETSTFLISFNLSDWYSEHKNYGRDTLRKHEYLVLTSLKAIIFHVVPIGAITSHLSTMGQNNKAPIKW